MPIYCKQVKVGVFNIDILRRDCKMEIFDLSIPVNEDTRVPTIDTGVSDPLIKFLPWVEIAHDGFKITKIEMGSHAGTHCDVQAHWVENGKTITDYPVENWIGWAVVMDFRGQGPISLEKILPYKNRIKGQSNVIPVILNRVSDMLTESARSEIISWNPQAILMGQGVNVDDKMTDSDQLLKAGVCMIMNANHEMVAKLKDNDLIIATPIKFTGLEAAPTRLIAIRGLLEK